MHRIAPFALAADGSLAVSTTDHELLAYDTRTQELLWVREIERRVVGAGVCAAGVLAADEAGTIHRFDRAEGATRATLPGKVTAAALVVVPEGDWALIHTAGIVLGYQDHETARLDLAGVVCAAFDAETRYLACGSSLGELYLVHVDTQRIRSFTLSAAISGLDWNPRGWWMVTTPYEIYQVRSARVPSKPLVTSDDALLSDGVCDTTGRVLAARAEDKLVRLWTADGQPLGQIEYTDARTGQIAFGPKLALGIGLGRGMAHLVDLPTAAVGNLQPPEARLPTVEAALDFTGPQIDERLEALAQREAEQRRRWGRDHPALAWTRTLGGRTGAALVVIGLLMAILGRLLPAWLPTAPWYAALSLLLGGVLLWRGSAKPPRGPSGRAAPAQT